MIGLDAVDLERFINWPNYSIKSLRKIFHQNEIEYAFSNPKKTIERLAVRFAAKEAFYKAYSAKFKKNCSLLFVFQNVWVDSDKNGAPILITDKFAFPEMCSYFTNLTLTHTKHTAVALVTFSTMRCL